MPAPIGILSPRGLDVLQTRMINFARLKKANSKKGGARPMIKNTFYIIEVSRIAQGADPCCSAPVRR
jgi:hypothetical protein